jgi:hypothetical protein
MGYAKDPYPPVSVVKKGRAVVTEFPLQAAATPDPMAPQYDPALSDSDMQYRGVYHPLGFAVEIYTNDPEVLVAAAEIWGHLPTHQVRATVQLRIGISESTSTVCPPAPTFRAHRHLISFIADAENHAFCDLNTGFGFAWISRVALAHRLYFRYHFLESIAMVLISGTFAPALHAACVSRFGLGMLLYGKSGAGKSTLAYACARAGFTYVTDDGSYLLRDCDHPRIAGHSHKIRFRPSSREFFPELQGRELTPRLEGKPSIEIPTSELPGLITSQEARIHYLILLKREPLAAAELVPIATKAALERFHADLYPVAEIRRLQIAALQQLDTVQSFELRYSNLDEATRCLEALAQFGCQPA